MIPKISVVTPTYNRSHLIAECLDSILAQTTPAYEIIIIDDGSVDNTRQVVARFIEDLSPGAPSIHYIYQPNAGPAAARNTGFKAATGDFIALWDSDDLCPPDRFAKELALFAAHPSLDFVFGNEAKFTDQNAPVPVWCNHGHKTGPLDAFDAFASRVNIPTSSVVFRTYLIETVGYMDSSVVPCEDMDYWIRSARSGANFGIVNEVLAYRRMHPGNLVNQKLRLKEAETAVLERYDCLGDDRMRRKLSENHYDLGSAYLKMMRWDKAHEHLSQVEAVGVKRRVLLAVKRAVVGLAA